MTSIIKVDQIQNAAGTTGLTIDSSGFVLPKTPTFQVKLSSGQSTTSASWTHVQFDVKNWDTAGEYDTSTYTYTPQTAGYYQFSLTLVQSDGNGNQVRTIGSIAKNDDNGGGRVWDVSFANSGFAGLDEGKTSSGSRMYYANGTTDYFNAWSWVQVGSGTPVINDTDFCLFSGFLVSTG